MKKLLTQICSLWAVVNGCLALTALVLTSGCNRDSLRSSPSGNRRFQSYSESELKTLIVSGMTTKELEAKFGRPGSITEMEPGVMMWMYSFPIQEQPGTYLAGFTVTVEKDHVVSWQPVTGETRQLGDRGAGQNSLGTQSFQFYVAVGGLTNVANLVHRYGVADGSQIKTASDIAFKAEVFAGKSGNERADEETVRLVISDENASKLKQLTEEHLGEHLLIVCRNQVVAAPVIAVPLESRQLLFTVKASTGLGKIRGY